MKDWRTQNFLYFFNIFPLNKWPHNLKWLNKLLYTSVDILGISLHTSYLNSDYFLNILLRTYIYQIGTGHTLPKHFREKIHFLIFKTVLKMTCNNKKKYSVNHLYSTLNISTFTLCLNIYNILSMRQLRHISDENG